MTDLAQKLRHTAVAPGNLAVCPLGQAGFLLKTGGDSYIAIDPYLTDYCEHKLGGDFKRLGRPVLTPEQLGELPLAAYLLTHHHIDHLDVECVERLQAAGHTAFPFLAPPASLDILRRLGVAEERCIPLFDGSAFALGEVGVHGVFADHGEAAPDAVGILLTANGKTVYHMGDTCLRAAEFRQISRRFAVDLLIAPINGMFGNMNEADAVAAVGIVGPKKAAPCHYWLLPGNSGGSNPFHFMQLLRRQAPAVEGLMPAPGEIVFV